MKKFTRLKYIFADMIIAKKYTSRLGAHLGNRKTPNAQSEGGFRGAGYEIRTRDFHLGKVTLYH